MDSLKKSFKSYYSYKYPRKISADTDVDSGHEQLPILLHQETPLDHCPPHPAAPSSMTSTTPQHCPDVVVKIDQGDSGGPAVPQGGKIWRESSYDFWNNGDESKSVSDGSAAASTCGNDEDGFDFRYRGHGSEDPPSMLIGKFLRKQKASGDMSLDMDLEMEEFQHDGTLPPVEESPQLNRVSKDLKVSFEEPTSNVVEAAGDTVRRRYKDSPGYTEVHKSPQRDQHGLPGFPRSGNAGAGDGEVVRCTSNASFERNLSLQRKSALLKVRNKSRLLDPPEEPDRKSGRVAKSGQMLSGMSGKKGEDEEDDPFLEEDVPDEWKQTHFSIWVLLEWLSLILFLAALACTLSIAVLRNKILWKLRLWKWEVMILVLICGRLVSDWVIRILVFFIERNFLLRKRVLYFVYGVRKAVQNCLWLGFVLIAWRLLFDKKVERETRGKNALQYVTKFLVCFLVGTLVLLAKTLVVKVMASSFYTSTYFDRIQESLFNQFVIETLSGPPLVEIQKSEEEEQKLADEVQKLENAGVNIPPELRATALSTTKSPRAAAFSRTKSPRATKSGMLQKSPRLISGKFSRPLSHKSHDGITIDHLHKLNPKNVSAWNMKRLMNMVRHGTLSTLDEQILDDENATQIRSENEARAAAKKIFQNVARRGCRFILLEDLMRFMQEDEAEKTMDLFEGASESGKISKSALKNWVVNAFRERRALALTLTDTKTAVNKLHGILNFIVGIIVMVIGLLILGIATTKFLLFVSSQLVLVAFIFGNTCKTVFEAIVFLFVMHPFDVGDRCEIDGVQVVVEELNILTTIFLRYDNQKIIIPNSVLATKAIHNYYRSPDMGDAIDFCIHVSTPAEKIALMKQRINSFIDNKKEHWYPSAFIVFRELEQLNMIRISIWPTHRMNHQDMGERFVRRSLLIEELLRIFREFDIQYRLLPLDINIRSMPATSERLPPSWATITS
ncbi:mechanosensitive ion channel protein 6-like [Prosopis cineraria]|uniref:mechanosensitive ion channel protein 6-like n=1 Tax=Prosopis cineraria TaxID=364024 RepID=UPI00240EBE94|nr:mechanosensitive ion channel protein 6-like [Prosopis cineraria]